MVERIAVVKGKRATANDKLTLKIENRFKQRPLEVEVGQTRAAMLSERSAYNSRKKGDESTSSIPSYPITHAAHVKEHSAAEFFAQVMDMHLHRIAFHFLVPTVELFLQSGTRQHGAGIFQ